MQPRPERPTPQELALAALAGAALALSAIVASAHGDPTVALADSRMPWELRDRKPAADVTLPDAIRLAESTSPAHAASCCRIRNHLPNGSTNVGSGTLIDVADDGRQGLVLSCAHLFTEGVGQVVVEFPDGRTHGAKVVAVDRAADLSALAIADPRAAPAVVSDRWDQTRPLTACGFGPTGQFRCVTGPSVGLVGDADQVNLKIAGSVRSGDSGGGIFDGRGRLVAVVWGESGGVTYGSSGGPFVRFLQRVLGRSTASGSNAASAGGIAASNGVAPFCPDGRCPLMAPGPLAGAPAARPPEIDNPWLGIGRADDAGRGVACGCGDDLAALAARLDALAAAKQDRGDFVARSELAALARTDQLAEFEAAQHRRTQSLVDRIERLARLVGAGKRIAAPLATGALGVAGPIGWATLAAVTVGSVLVGRALARKAGVARRETRDGGQSELAPRAPKRAPHQEATADADHCFRLSTRAETREPIERDDRETRQLLRLSQLEGRDPLQDAVAGRLALDRLDSAAEGDADPQRARWADELRRELRERFNDIAPTKLEVKAEGGGRQGDE